MTDYTQAGRQVADRIFAGKDLGIERLCNELGRLHCDIEKVALALKDEAACNAALDKSIIERLNKLEAKSKPTSSPSQIRSSLVERVDDALMRSIKDNDSMARAAIREVASWMQEKEGDYSMIAWLEFEVDL